MPLLSGEAQYPASPTSATRPDVQAGMFTLDVNGSTDPADGNPVTKTGANGQRVGANGRAVVNEFRETVRGAVSTFRTAVKETVNAVTGLGKQEENLEANNENQDPAPNP
jgi:hypothetical protein